MEAEGRELAVLLVWVVAGATGCEDLKCLSLYKAIIGGHCRLETRKLNAPSLWCSPYMGPITVGKCSHC